MMSPTAQATFRERFGIEPWTDVYGQTECMPITATPIALPACCAVDTTPEAAAAWSGFTPASTLLDAPFVLEGQGIESSWRPENHGGRFGGPTRLREALGGDVVCSSAWLAPCIQSIITT